ncbi:hypothetical protein [Streptomyces parvulus]|uniref:Uncharacterized protein n=1 Tax=Streptomyces parvulus TaxID=146923 RepID=A0A369UT36_9ACTN|nr:hypothetical protein [Streptomyces parvulus]RDD83914.1 hypothetical protein DVZ84_38035 [Streptomyces parvulus]
MTGIEWGTAPAWLSAILTGGSLLLGFYILLRDRRKEERLDASKVVAMYYPEGDEYSQASRVRVVLKNTADRPIFFPGALYGEKKGKRLRGWPCKEDVVEPGEFVEVEVPRQVEGKWVGIAGVYFHDADGCIWARDFSDFSLVRKGKPFPTRKPRRRRRAFRRVRVTAW